jgi:hypothetical protein
MSERDPKGRFTPGMRANPYGRPRKIASVGDTILGALSENVHITERGKRKRVTKLQATAKQLANQGASGDHRASRLVFDLAQKAEEKLAAAPPSSAELNARDQAIVEGLFIRWLAIQEKGPGRGPDDTS